MARPKRLVPNEPATERVIAHEDDMPRVSVPVPAPPLVKQIERQGDAAVPSSARYPQIKAGTCDACGTLDPKVPGRYQYKLCGHYRGMDIRCSYCPDTKDPDEIVGSSIMNVADHPYNPGIIIAWCNSYECTGKHLARFKVNA